MNWITTNVRFPEDRYMELKMMAAQNRKSIADLIRKGVDMLLGHKKKMTKSQISKLMKEMDVIAKEIARQNKGISLSQELIKMRYEQ